MFWSLCLPKAISHHAPGVTAEKRILHGAFGLSPVNQAMDLEGYWLADQDHREQTINSIAFWILEK